MPIYAARKHNRIVNKILVNGADITSLCLEADTDRGCVKLFVRHRSGKIVICRDKSNDNDEGDPLVAIAYGKVEVILHDLPQQLIDAGGILED